MAMKHSKLRYGSVRLLDESSWELWKMDQRQGEQGV